MKIKKMELLIRTDLCNVHVHAPHQTNVNKLLSAIFLHCGVGIIIKEGFRRCDVVVMEGLYMIETPLLYYSQQTLYSLASLD